VKKERTVVVGLVAVLAYCVVAPSPADAIECVASADENFQRRAEQKIVLLDRMVGDTAPVRRVFESDHADAKTAIAAAREAVKRARQDLVAGCVSRAAETTKQGFSQASRAFSLVRDQRAGGEDQYRMLHQRTASYLETLESHPAEIHAIGADELVRMERQLNRADTLAISGEHSEASALLNPIADRLERRFTVMFDQQTVYYEQSFEIPEDEYEYFTEQYRLYLLLLQKIAAERQTPFSSDKYNLALQDAAIFNEEAKRLATAGEWEASLTAISEALKKCKVALRLMGIAYF